MKRLLGSVALGFLTFIAIYSALLGPPSGVLTGVILGTPLILLTLFVHLDVSGVLTGGLGGLAGVLTAEMLPNRASNAAPPHGAFLVFIALVVLCYALGMVRTKLSG